MASASEPARHARRRLLPVLLAPLLAACGTQPAALPRPHAVEVHENSIGMRLARVPAGSFPRGSAIDEPGHRVNEGPRRTVRITRPYYLGVHEVTVGDFTRFVEATGYRTDAERDAEGGFGIDFTTGRVEQQSGITWRDPGFPGFTPGPEHPVVLISWQDAERFCRWLSEREGRTYRLPTEAEWEHAARAGATSAYAFGDDPAALPRHANVADASLKRAMPAARDTAAFDDGFPWLAPVGSFAPNAFGLHDMHGNVWEWCADWYRADAYAGGATVDPQGPTHGRFRAIRGGGWLNAPLQNRAAQRVYFDPRFRYCLLSGFRVLLEIPAGDDEARALRTAGR